jgi:DUF4097 and DUF4098 domain-containing protein YvlB
MQLVTLETRETPTLSITECRGDLNLRGWTKPTVEIRGDEGTVEARQEGDTIMVRGGSDLRIHLPQAASVQIQAVLGDARLKALDGPLSIERVEGDLVLKRVDSVTVGSVRGDLVAGVLAGDLTVDQVGGDMSVRSVTGRLQVQRVGRDLGVRDVEGDAHAPDVHGDIRLRTNFTPGRTYTLHAGGDLVARVPADANATLTLRSERRSIHLKTQLFDEVRKNGEITGRLGDGGATVTLEARRDLVLIARETGSDMGEVGFDLGAEFGLEFAGLAEDIAAQVESQMAEMNSRLEARLGAFARLDERAAKAAEKAQRHAERAAERLRAAAERQAEEARRRAQSTRRAAPTPPRKPSPPRRGAPAPPAGEPVTDEERLAILNMVAEGKITVEEAENLLEALSS